MSILTHLKLDSDGEWNMYVQPLPHAQVKAIALHGRGLCVTAVGYLREDALQKVHRRIDHIKEQLQKAHSQPT